MKRRKVETELSKLKLDSFTVIVAKHYKIAARYRGKGKCFSSPEHRHAEERCPTLQQKFDAG